LIVKIDGVALNITTLEDTIKTQLGGLTLLYHSKSFNGPLFRDLRNGIRETGGLNNEFSPGLYTTPNLRKSLEYLGRINNTRTGFTYVFAWQNTAQFRIKYLEGEDWTKEVRGNVADEKCGAEMHDPYDENTDFWVGDMTGNYKAIEGCAQPIIHMPKVLQYVAKNREAYNHLAANLVAILVFE